MTGVGAHRLIIELDYEADPIAGRIVDAAGDATSFSGWLELAGALSAARFASRSQQVQASSNTALNGRTEPCTTSSGLS